MGNPASSCGVVSPWLGATDFVTGHVYTAEGRYLPSLYVLDSLTNGGWDAVEVVAVGHAPTVVTNQVVLGEDDAYGGEWTLNLPVSNIIQDAEGLVNSGWSISNTPSCSRGGRWEQLASHAFRSGGAAPDSQRRRSDSAQSSCCGAVSSFSDMDMLSCIHRFVNKPHYRKRGGGGQLSSASLVAPQITIDSP